jgi:hypothetical protein
MAGFSSSAQLKCKLAKVQLPFLKKSLAIEQLPYFKIS